MKTKYKDIEVPEGTKGLVYLCEYTRGEPNNQLIIRGVGFFSSVWKALEAYANIPNPASQIVMETKRETFEQALEKLHKNMENQEWVNDLDNYL